MKRSSFDAPSTFSLLSRGFGAYKRNIFFLIFLGFISVVFEGIGVNAIIPLLAFATRSDTGSPTDLITRQIRHAVETLGIPFSIKFLLIFIVTLFVFRAITLYWSTVLKMRISSIYEARTREYLFDSFTRADWPFLLEQKLGHLETVLLTNVRYGSSVLEQVCTAAIVVVNLFVYILVAFNISALITVLTLLLGAISLVFFRPLFGGSRKTSREIEGLNKEIAHFLNENLLGMKTVKTMSVGPAVVGIGRTYFERMRQAVLRISTLKAKGDVLMQPIGVLFISILFAVYYKSTAFQIGAFAAIIYLIQRIFVYFQQLQSGWRGIQEYVPYLQAQVELTDLIQTHRERNSGVEPFVFNHVLKFDDVSFSYPGGGSQIRGVSFEIQKGQTVGLIGPSGAGKTTLVDLVLRLFEPTGGSISLDGKDANSVKLAAWREKIGYVSQDVFLINNTISENIKFYHPEITDEDVETAAKKANIFEFIQTLPNAFETVIGERGIFLSVGQRQRIIIARVLARKPELLVLDEATSSLDNESEAQIQNVIRDLKGRMTVLIIAHRLSTIMDADSIIALEAGRVIEQGPPKDLLDNTESYLYKAWHARGDSPASNV